MKRKKFYAGQDSRGHVWEIHPLDSCLFSDSDLNRVFKTGGRGCYVGDFYLAVRDYEIVAYGDRDQYLADIWEDSGVIVATITETA